MRLNLFRADAKYTSSRNQLLDAMRGIAILQVLVWHTLTPLLLRHAPVVGAALILTWTGVDLFFVLSGYLLGGILIRNRESPNFYKTFYGRRFLRILPLYWLCIGLYFLIFRPGESFWPYVTFTQNFIWAFTGQWGPNFLGVTWSLAVEEQFYLILPFLIRACQRRVLPIVLASLVAAAPVCRIVAVAFGNPLAAYMLMPCRMDALFLGVLLAWATFSIERRELLRRRQRDIGLIAVAGGALLIGALAARLDVLNPIMATIGYSVIAVAYTSCFALLLNRHAKLPPILKPLAWCGLGAYSIYLFHKPLLMTAHTVFEHRPVVALLATYLCAAAVATVCWLCFEAPLIALGHKWFRYSERVAQRRDPNPLAAVSDA